MESMFMNAPSSSSSMRGTYPPSHNKSSTVTLKHGKNAPTENKSHHSFVLHSSSAALRLGRRGRHRKSLHKRKEVVANMSKGKLKVDGNGVRTGWTDPREVKGFCDFSAAQVLDGKKHNGYLRKEGVDAVIEQLAEIGKVVTHTQFKNKRDHLRKLWKAWKECFGETGLGYDPVTGVMQADDEWWTRKIQACPKALTFKNKPLPNIKSMEIMFEGTGHNDISHSHFARVTYGGSEGGHYDGVADVAFYLDSNEMKEVRNNITASICMDHT